MDPSARLFLTTISGRAEGASSPRDLSDAAPPIRPSPLGIPPSACSEESLQGGGSHRSAWTLARGVRRAVHFSTLFRCMPTAERRGACCGPERTPKTCLTPRPLRRRPSDPTQPPRRSRRRPAPERCPRAAAAIDPHGRWRAGGSRANAARDGALGRGGDAQLRPEYRWPKQLWPK